MVNINQVGFGLMGAGGYIMSTSFMPDGIPVNLAPPGIPPVARMLAGMGLATLGGALTIIQPPK